LCGGLVGASPAAHAARDPIPFSRFKRKLPKSQAGKRAALRRYARDSRNALSHRISANQAWAKTWPSADRHHLDAAIFEAHLRGIGNDGRRRKGALRKALRQAGRLKLEAKRTLLGKALKLEALDDQLKKAIERRVNKESHPLGDADKKLLAQVGDANSVYRGIGNKHHARLLQLLALELRSTTPEGAARIVDKVTPFLAMGGKSRDYADIRARARWLRARAYKKEGRTRDALIDAMAADHAQAFPVKMAISTKPEALTHTRSLKTSDLCFEAKNEGLDCFQIEIEEFGWSTHYDFSKEKKGRFSPQRAKRVLAEYEPLLITCIEKAARTDLPATRIEVEWPVHKNGRVKEFELKPRRVARSSLQRCFRDALALFRYPPYRGEMQHIGMDWRIGEN
jgi:hypothetical protein